MASNNVPAAPNINAHETNDIIVSSGHWQSDTFQMHEKKKDFLAEGTGNCRLISENNFDEKKTDELILKKGTVLINLPSESDEISWKLKHEKSEIKFSLTCYFEPDQSNIIVGKKKVPVSTMFSSGPFLPDSNFLKTALENQFSIKLKKRAPIVLD